MCVNERSICPKVRSRFGVRLSPTTLILQHGRGHGRGRACQGHSGLRVDNRNNLAGPGRRRLLEVHLIEVTSNTGVHVRVGRCRRQRDGRSDLLDGLDLVLKGRGVGRSTGHRGPVGGCGMDGVELYRHVLSVFCFSLLPCFYSQIFICKENVGSNIGWVAS